MQAVTVTRKRFPPPAGLAPDVHERLPRNVRGAGGCQGAGLQSECIEADNFVFHYFDFLHFALCNLQ
jgi:hypothetical protein